MRRLVLMLLLCVLPLQTLWAAGAGHCLPGPAVGDDAPGQHGQGHEHGATSHAHDHAGPSGGAGQASGSAVDCSAFHFVGLDASEVGPEMLSALGGLPFNPLSIFFKSHIPPGPDRPRWRLAA